MVKSTYLTGKSIYLAGKMQYPNWREEIVEGLDSVYYSDCSGNLLDCDYPQSWPVLPKAVLGRLDYTGPYFINDGHGCNFGPSEHGASALSAYRQYYVHSWCLDAISRSDIVFAWIDDHTAYGTFAELGYAKALGKTIWIAGPDLRHVYQDRYGDPCSELWFIYHFADKTVNVRSIGPKPIDALKAFLPPQFNSPIEEMFWNAWEVVEGDESMTIPLTPQYKIGKYRLDFAHELSKTAIELDGHATHSSPDAIAYDRKRQREIEAAGWKVIRYGGKEVTSDVYRCALEAHRMLSHFMLHRIR